MFNQINRVFDFFFKTTFILQIETFELKFLYGLHIYETTHREETNEVKYANSKYNKIVNNHFVYRKYTQVDMLREANFFMLHYSSESGLCCAFQCRKISIQK